MAKLKVLFHVNEPGRWQRALLNIHNFINDSGQGNVEVEVVANGAAVVVYGDGQDGELIGEMSKLAGMGVRFAACRNALKMHSLYEDILPPFITVVSAGITELAIKQAGGYAYIKP
ncbi:MAG: DsrE family protein [Desulfocucumaceae bacterium]